MKLTSSPCVSREWLPVVHRSTGVNTGPCTSGHFGPNHLLAPVVLTDLIILVILVPVPQPIFATPLDDI